MPNDIGYVATELDGDFTVEGWVTTVNSSGNWVSPNSNIIDRLDTIEKRLCIIAEPDEDLMSKYPALREAYESYQLIEQLVNEPR